MATPPAIPHILHQSWRTNQVPRGLERAISSWRALQPKWRYAFHSDRDNEKLVEAKYPWMLRHFRRLSGIQQADVSRYLYMHAFGGVYADLDMALLKPLAPLLRSLRQKHGANASVIFGQEPLAHAVLLEGRPRQVCNAFIASTPGHPFWLSLLKRIVGAPQRGFGDPVSSTGPRMLERVVRQWRGGGVLIADPDVFYPTWDPMQSNTFRERCTVTTRRRPSLPAQVRDVPLQMRERVCQRLRREGFRPVVSKAAYTNHLWTHTWINGATKVSLHDVYRLDTSGGANVPSGRRPRRQNRTAFLRSSRGR